MIDLFTEWERIQAATPEEIVRRHQAGYEYLTSESERLWQQTGIGDSEELVFRKRNTVWEWLDVRWKSDQRATLRQGTLEAAS